jgi:hypothetical protein
MVINFKIPFINKHVLIVFSFSIKFYTPKPVDQTYHGEVHPDEFI